MAENETDRTTSPDAAKFLKDDVALPRIEAIVANARAVWFGQIGFLAFITVTLISVRDVDFFSVTATTDLPIINVAIPTTTFFWTAAWLAAVLHTYLHLFLLRLWDALAEAPADLDGLRLGERVFPWLVNDWALRRRPDRPLETRPMDWLADTVTLVLVWLGTPGVLVAFWWFSMPAHDAWLTLAIAGALGLSLFASANGWHRAKARLRCPGRRENNASDGNALPEPWRRASVAVGIVLAAFSLLRTEIGDIRVGPFHSEGFLLASIDLADAEIAVRPDDWRDHELAQRRFRIDWCDDNGLPGLACEAEPLGPAHTAWCEANAITDCPTTFRELDAAFAAEWNEERGAYLDNLIRPDLRGRDLRRASVSGAFLAGINLSEARLEGADLRGALLEGADLGDAQLEGANLRAARLERALLRGARLAGADLSEARLEEADLSKARLEGADLSDARLEGANLNGAGLEGADLSNASLQEANFEEAQMGGANLRRAQVQRANFSNAVLDGANLHVAKLMGAIFFRASLEGANLSYSWLQGAQLFLAQMRSADLTAANLNGADLRSAQLTGVNLSEARLEGADLRNARLQSTDWTDTEIGRSPAHAANFSDAQNLTQEQLALVIGDATTILPHNEDAKQLLHVWSCWEQSDVEVIRERWTRSRLTPADQIRDMIRREEWACLPGSRPTEVLMAVEVNSP